MADEKSKKTGWLIWASIISLVLLLTSPLALYHLHNQAKFNRLVEELAADGYPVSMADLEAAYILPEDAENAAELYVKAFHAYVEPNEVEREWLPVRGAYQRVDGQSPYPEEVMDIVRQSLDKNAECLALLDEAARMDYCLFERQFDKHFSLFSDYFSEIKKTAMMLVERNLLLAHTGRTDALFDSLQTCIAQTNSLTVQPRLIEHLVCIALEAMIAQSLEGSMNMARFSDEQLTILQQQFHRMLQRNTIKDAWITERAGFNEILQMPPFELLEAYYGTSPSLSYKATCVLYWLSGLMKKDSVLLLDFYQRQIDISEFALHDQPAEIDKLKTEAESYPFYHYVFHMWVPTFRVSEINLRVKGQLQCAETALAIERYRLKYNSLPESLHTLVPDYIDAVYLDPFDGKPIRYVLLDTGGYMLYTIGDDRIDNGGLDRDQMSKKTGTTRSDEQDHPFLVKR